MQIEEPRSLNAEFEWRRRIEAWEDRTGEDYFLACLRDWPIDRVLAHFSRSYIQERLLRSQLELLKQSLPERKGRPPVPPLA